MLPAFQAPFDQKWNDQVRRAIREGTDADAPIENAAPTTYGDVIRPGSDWQRVARYEEPATNPKYSGMTSAQEIYQNRLTGQRSLFHVIEQPGTGRIVGIHHIHFRPYLKVRSGTRAVD
jgi:hypothetical protein